MPPFAADDGGYARLLEESERKDVFMATLAHELRNMISPLSCALEILDVGRMDPESMDRALPVARRQVDHMCHLIEDLLDLGRMVKGDIYLNREVLSLRKVAEETVEACAPLFASQSLAAQLGDDPLPVLGDSLRLTQVITNLLHNAAKFTPAGGHIRLTASRCGDSAVLRIHDDGVGIAPDQLEGVFSMFSQETQDARMRQQGLGIGLALVRKLVNLHGGQVTAESEGAGCGSTFTVSLPLARVA
jgi:signal transduction histidine kinase